jgi:3-phenylpropionate/cinnamic acid dioxygenase small subunit
MVAHEVFHEVEQFYFREARLFSEHRYREWLQSMVDEKIHYWMPIFEDRLKNDRRPMPELVPAVYDDDYADLDDRIARLETGLVWTEDPPSRIRHLVTNVEAYDASGSGEIEAYSNFLVCRNRLEREETILIGGREDRLVRRGGELRILRRKIVVPQRVVQDTNLYYFI